jgi:repressor LexA
MQPLTPRQAEVLDWILGVVEEKGYFPSYREIGEAFGMRSPASIARHIDALVRKGRLVREGGRIHPAGGGRAGGRPGPGIPIVGHVAAGHPILAEEHIEDHLVLGDLYGHPHGAPHEDGVFAVRVVGDSMVEAGILPGDLAIVREQHRVASGLPLEGGPRRAPAEEPGARADPDRPGRSPLPHRRSGGGGRADARVSAPGVRPRAGSRGSAPLPPGSIRRP